MPKSASFAITSFGANFKQLQPEQKKTITYYILSLLFFLILSIGILGYKLHVIKLDQDNYIEDRINVTSYTESEARTDLKNDKQVNTVIYFWNMNDINMKEKYLNMNLYVGLTYAESDFPLNRPEIGIYNGRLVTQQQIIRKIESGNVNEFWKINADVEPHYMVQLFPLDRELISVRLVPKDQGSNYYFKVVELYDSTEGAQSSYSLMQMKYYNSIQSPQELYGDVAPVTDKSYKFAHSLLQDKPYLGMNRSYMLFEHKSFYSYLKSIQYILLSISIAIFSLLINAKTNSPKNGRVAVIGSSVFALAANVFQLNANNRPTNLITVIDLMTFFCGIIIILCFLITIRTLRFLDDDGYSVAKLFDQAAFTCIFTFSVIFFMSIYLYA